MSEKTLIVCSNHPPEKWQPAQKTGWDRIIHVPFPNVPPDAGEEEFNEIELDTMLEISGAIRQVSGEIYVCIQGDFSLTLTLVENLKFARDNRLYDNIKNIRFIYPTTERKVVEKDGKRTYEFKFVQWREILK